MNETQKNYTLPHSDLSSTRISKKTTNSLFDADHHYNEDNLQTLSPLSGSVSSSHKHNQNVNESKDDNIPSLNSTPTLVSASKRQKKFIPLSRYERITITSLICLRSSIALVFFGYFLALQPYNSSISQYVSHAHNSIKLTSLLIF